MVLHLADTPQSRRATSHDAPETGWTIRLHVDERERLAAAWCARLPSPAPEMLRTLAAHSERYIEPSELASALGKKPTGGHWNSGIALLRNNGLVEVSGKRLRVSELFR